MKGSPSRSDRSTSPARRATAAQRRWQPRFARWRSHAVVDLRLTELRSVSRRVGSIPRGDVRRNRARFRRASLQAHRLPVPRSTTDDTAARSIRSAIGTGRSSAVGSTAPSRRAPPAAPTSHLVWSDSDGDLRQHCRNARSPAQQAAAAIEANVSSSKHEPRGTSGQGPRTPTAIVLPIGCCAIRTARSIALIRTRSARHASRPRAAG